VDIPKINPKLYVPIGIGISLFVSEFVLGWLSLILVLIPMSWQEILKMVLWHISLL